MIETDRTDDPEVVARTGVSLEVSPPAIPPLRLQHDAEQTDAVHYLLDELLRYHDRAFIHHVYAALAKREPTQTELTNTLDDLRSGRRGKIEIIECLLAAQTGGQPTVHVDGLPSPMRRRLSRWPVIGYMLRIVRDFARMPLLIQDQQQFEAYALGQQQRIADYVNDMIADFQTQREALAEQQQRLDELHRAQGKEAAGQREFLVQEQHVIVETQKAVLAEIQERLDELQRKYQQNRVALLTQERQLFSLPTGAQTQPAASGSKAPRPTAEPAHGDEAGSLNLDSLYASFEDQFRGPRSVIKEQLKFYLPLLRAARAGTVERPVLDVGCGRGEWLELLREEGLHARGVDANGVLVEQCAARGLDVAKTDALTYLRSLAEDSLSALTGFHIIEHLSFLALVELLDETLRVLRPGGLVILETPNPKNLVVGACNFYSDPTHQRPLFPETLQFLLDQRGFAQVRVEYLHPVDDGPVWQAEPGAQALHGWFYGPRDFAVIGSKA